jgi:hypothetical protein
MAGERYRILFLPAAHKAVGYSSVQRGTSPPAPVRDRTSHSAYLGKRLDQTWSEDQLIRTETNSAKRGTYVEFLGPSETGLSLISLDSSGLDLVNVRQVHVGDSLLEAATVFVPDRVRGKFLRKLNDYADPAKDKAGRKDKNKLTPSNHRLFASINDIRLAIVGSFWTESSKDLKPPTTAKQWVEVWLNGSADDDIGRFRSTLQELKVREHESERLVTFPERTVLVVSADGQDLAKLIAHSDQVAEFRAAHAPATPLVLAANREQAEWVEDLRARSSYPKDDKVSVCLLDTGVNNGHPLLEPILADADLHAVEPAWSKNDVDGHGTLMAGLAGYGDLQAAVTSGEPVALGHRLESSKILPDKGSNPEKLYGAITAQGVYAPEIEAGHRIRTYCSAVTSETTCDQGRPTSWSGAVDQLTSGAEDDKRRLFIQAAGNIQDPLEWKAYPASNFSKQVHDPAQAWNALTVGALTLRDRITHPNYAGFTPIAKPHELSPYTSTSLLWAKPWPIKPEVVFEGGNVAMDPNGSASDIDDLQLLSTYHNTTKGYFGFHNATSAASAQAAHMAATIQRAYPDAWPETVRALIVHSARWTDAMIRQCQSGNGAQGMLSLLRSCGYGLPDLERATNCMRNRLTLVSEAEIQPFEEGRSKEMHLYELPWPREVLLELGQTEVRMRVTLSYFIEPGPGEIGWKDRYRYRSHGLKFELNSSGESAQEFMRRINAQARDEEEGAPGTPSPKEWLIGTNTRNKGSIHSDIWVGRAADLAASNLIGIVPTIGWWRERKHLGKSNKRTRYTLVVSIETPEEEVDIYTPVAVQVGVPVPVPIVVGGR